MGVSLHGLLTNTSLMRKLHIGLLFPQDALSFSLLFLSQLFVKTSENSKRGSFCVCESGQQPLGMVRAKCVETPNPFLVARLPSDREKECWRAIGTSGSDQVTQPCKNPREDAFCRGSYVTLALRTLGRKGKSVI